MITTTFIKIDENRNVELTYDSAADATADEGVYLEVRDESGDAGLRLNEQSINELFTAVTIMKTRMATARNQRERAQ